MVTEAGKEPGFAQCQSLLAVLPNCLSKAQPVISLGAPTAGVCPRPPEGPCLSLSPRRTHLHHHRVLPLRRPGGLPAPQQAYLPAALLRQAPPARRRALQQRPARRAPAAQVRQEASGGPGENLRTPSPPGTEAEARPGRDSLGARAWVCRRKTCELTPVLPGIGPISCGLWSASGDTGLRDPVALRGAGTAGRGLGATPCPLWAAAGPSQGITARWKGCAP